MKFYFRFFYFFAITMAMVSMAEAQNRLPEFSLGGTLTDIEDTQDETVFDYQIETPLMKDILTLQEQVNLLEALVERQSEIQKIAESYEDMGLEFKQPAPSIEVCERLPVNVLCLFSYPDMKKNTNIVEQQKQRMLEKQQQAIDEAIASIIESNQPLAAPSFSDDGLDDLVANIPVIEQSIKDVYYWSDIQCFLNTCSALIISSLDDMERYRVSKGDRFGDDIKVQDINISGIKVSVNDKHYFLGPKPLSSQPKRTQSQPRSGDIARLLDRQQTSLPPQPDIMRGLESTNQSMAAPAQQISRPQMPSLSPASQSKSNNQPLLGPTGLF